ncbi:hypothetical protein DPMN_090053, partial [Dreissena polymorpha]
MVLLGGTISHILSNVLLSRHTGPKKEEPGETCCVELNTGSAEIKGQPQDADEDDTSEENAEPVGVSVPRAVADDTHVEENPEWEMGIRRSSTAK